MRSGRSASGSWRTDAGRAASSVVGGRRSRAQAGSSNVDVVAQDRAPCARAQRWIGAERSSDPLHRIAQAAAHRDRRDRARVGSFECLAETAGCPQGRDSLTVDQPRDRGVVDARSEPQGANRPVACPKLARKVLAERRGDRLFGARLRFRLASPSAMPGRDGRTLQRTLTHFNPRAMPLTADLARAVGPARCQGGEYEAARPIRIATFEANRCVPAPGGCAPVIACPMMEPASGGPNAPLTISSATIVL